MAWEAFLEQMRLELGPDSREEEGIFTLSFNFLFSDALTSGPLLTLEGPPSKSLPVPRDGKQLTLECTLPVPPPPSGSHT